MANEYGVCPTCGCPHGAWHMQQQQMNQPPMWGPPPPWAQPQMGYPQQVCYPQQQAGYPQQQMGGPGYAGQPCGPGYGPQHYAPSYYGGLPSDSEIEEMIYDSIDADPLVPFDANIDVSVEAGTVFLNGEVNSKRTKHAAGDDAWWIPGVIDVHNDIRVSPRKRPEREEQET